MQDVATLVSASLVFEICLMTAVWALSVRIKNAAIVDVAWAASFLQVAVIYAALKPGFPDRKYLLTAMVASYSIRLTAHLAGRILSENKEDDRYAELRRHWKAAADRNFFAFFQLQALTVIVLSAPFVASCLDRANYLHRCELAAVVLFCLSLTGEFMADWQLQQFKSNPANRGEVCNIGLWRYSRHPNYFFEWLIWCAFYLFAVQSPMGLCTFFSPLLMLLFLTKMSGIPLAEKQSLKSKGEKYVRYQKQTSAFVPWFRR